MSFFATYRTYLIHSTAWILYMVLHTLLFYQFFPDVEVVMLRGSSIALIHASIFYLNLKVFYPFFLERRQLLFYVMAVLSSLFLVMLYFQIVDALIMPERFFEFIDMQHQRMGRPPRSHEPGDFPRFPRHFGLRGKTLVNGFMTVAVFFVSTLLGVFTERNRREKEQMELKNQLLQAETTLLKFQINPHFLFNTLNNIYSLSVLKSEKAPDAVQRLSEMLRYVIYNSNNKGVSLGKETEYIQSYIDLQLLKDEQIDQVTVALSEVDHNLQIAPMLLIPFVENSFKHSHFEDVQNGWIDLSMKTVDQKLLFRISNSVPKLEMSKDGIGGIGLSNVRRRLELLYPDRYTLEIHSDTERYTVNLQLELDDPKMPHR